VSEWNRIPEKQKARYHTICGLSKHFKTNLAESEAPEPEAKKGLYYDLK